MKLLTSKFSETLVPQCQTSLPLMIKLMLSESPGKIVFFISFPPSEMLIGFLQMHLLNIKFFMIVNS